MTQVTRPGGTVAGYVWDYDHPDFFLARFFAALEAVVGARHPDDERGRWAVCTTPGLTALLETAGNDDAVVGVVETPTTWSDVDELWDGFTLGIGPTGSVLAQLDGDLAAQVRRSFVRDLPVASDGSVTLSARALTFSFTV